MRPVAADFWEPLALGASSVRNAAHHPAHAVKGLLRNNATERFQPLNGTWTGAWSRAAGGHLLGLRVIVIKSCIEAVYRSPVTGVLGQG